MPNQDRQNQRRRADRMYVCHGKEKDVVDAREEEEQETKDVDLGEGTSDTTQA